MAAQYQGKDDWFEGTIEKLNADGTYNVLYSDGDRESGVAEQCVKLMSEVAGM